MEAKDIRSKREDKEARKARNERSREVEERDNRVKKVHRNIKRGIKFFRERTEEVKGYEIIKDKSLQGYSVKKKCLEINISETGYYKWLKGKESASKEKERFLLLEIKKAYMEQEDNKNYGVKRIKIRLEQKGIKASLHKVKKVMKANGLIKKKKRYTNGITKADAEAQKSENILNRNFKSDEPNRKWLSDISEVQCKDGKLYISAILDCFNGEIVGLEMEDNMRADLCVRTIRNAVRATREIGMLVHTDRGSQYTSWKYREELKKIGAIQSMSGTGKCYDNARMESFFATLKKEKLYQIKTHLLSMSEVKSIIWKYVIVYYNRMRITTVNEGGLPPAIYREKYEKRIMAA